MERVKIIFPKNIHHSCELPILVQHINYGNHVGNDSIVSLLHHARVSLLYAFGFSELDIGGAGMIMADLQVQYKKQLFLHDTIILSSCVEIVSTSSFAIYYKIEKKVSDNTELAVLAKTNMICFDYQNQKICSLPQIFIEKFQ